MPSGSNTWAQHLVERLPVTTSSRRPSTSVAIE
jgi:hypothetical protein